MFWKVAVTCLITAMIFTFAGCSADDGETKTARKKFQPGENTMEMKSTQENLYSDGRMVQIDFYGHKNEQGMPVEWSLVVDEHEMVRLDGENGTYTIADFKLQDIDGKKGPEVLLYLYNTGSSGAQRLNIFKPSKEGWHELFNVPNPFDMGAERFESQYVGDYKVNFRDKETGLEHIIDLEKDRYDGIEEMLEGISTWVDPIAEYRIDDHDRDGVDEIVTVQRVIGVAHVDTIATLQTVYRLRDGRYQAGQVILTTDTGELLVEKKM